MPLFIRGRELAQTSRRDAVFGSAMLQMEQTSAATWGYTVPHHLFQGRRRGHVSILIDPSAFKESVAAIGLVFPVWQNILSGV
jgi:hypothetical protein